jgi:hypothetical protein
VLDTGSSSSFLGFDEKVNQKARGASRRSIGPGAAARWVRLDVGVDNAQGAGLVAADEPVLADVLGLAVVELPRPTL